MYDKNMYNENNLLLTIATVLAFSIIGAILMMGVDLGGTRWLKFVLYASFFASISSPALFSSHASCISVLRKRS